MVKMVKRISCGIVSSDLTSRARPRRWMRIGVPLVLAVLCAGCGRGQAPPDEPALNPPASAQPAVSSESREFSAAAPVATDKPPEADPDAARPGLESPAPSAETAEGPADAAPAQPSLPQTVDFQPLSLAEPVTSMALTEDGRFLIVTHQAANQVSVWDRAADATVRTLETPFPRSVLCRGDGVYIVNAGQGTISLFSQSDNWELKNQFEVDPSNIVHLSAARGDNFNGELLVTCHGEGSQGSYRGARIFHVDTSTDRQKLVSQGSLASVSYDGKLVLAQGSFNLSPSGGIRAYPYADFLGGNPQSIFAGGESQTPFVDQVHPGSFWFGSHMVFAGAPIKLLRKDLGNIIVPDLAQRVIYALTRERLRAHRLDTALTEIGSRRATWPQPQKDKFDGIYHTLYRHRAYLLDHPVAFTRGNELQLFVIDMSRNLVLTARTAALESPRALAEPRVSRPAPRHDR